MSHCSAKDVLKHLNILNFVINLKSITKNEKHYKVIAHNVSKTLTLQELKLEIEMYNDVQLIRESMWLKKVQDFAKTHTSVVLIFNKKNQALLTLQDLNIVEVRCITAKFNEIKFTIQCVKCQKYEHMHNTCKVKS